MIVRNMRFPLRIASVLVLCGAGAFPLRGHAESPPSVPGSPVKQASFTHAQSDEDGPQSVRFGRQPSRVGDRIEQNLSLEMRLKLTMRRENELVGNNQTTVRTKQHRIVVATAVEGGTTMAARVEYPEATKQVVAAEAPTAAQLGDTAGKNGEAVAAYEPIAQAVQGKTYLCQREPGERAN